MSDEPDLTPPIQPDEPPVDIWELGDDFLATWVSIANESGIEFGVTLLVRGTVVTGLLAPAPEYFETFGELFAGAMPVPDETKMELRRSFVSRAMSYRVPNEGVSRIGYVHIKNARVLHSTGFFPEESTAWLRLRLSEVSGWMLGTMTSWRS